MEGNTRGRAGPGWAQVCISAVVMLCLVWGIAWVASAPAPRPPAKTPKHAVRGAAMPVNCARVACLALTFDDGPSRVVTPQVLDTLERHKVRATFYVLGSRVSGNEELLRRMHRAGHEIGNHSWSHPDLTKLSPAEVRDQVVSTQAAVASAGVPLPTTFRPPYGAVNDVVESNVRLTIVRWNVDPEDWGDKGAHDISHYVAAHAKPGGIVDLHDIHQRTADSLEQILVDLSPKYEFVTVSELLHLPPGQRGEFFGRSPAP